MQKSLTRFFLDSLSIRSLSLVVLFGAIDEEKMCGGWKFFKIDWHNKEDIPYETLQPDDWIRCDKVSKFSVKKLSRLLRYNYTY